MRVPERDDAARRALVDVAWGQIKPLHAAEGVETVGELELAAEADGGAQLVDTRGSESFRRATIPGARNLPKDEIVERWGELSDRPVVLFCNGPQCPATPTAIQRLLNAGCDPGSLRYYRGGMHDWVTLGLPVEPGAAHQA